MRSLRTSSLLRGLALFGLLFAAPAAGEEREGEAEAKPGAARAAEELSAGDVAADPARYYGQQVSVVAEVERVANPHVFTLDEDRIGASPDVLVLLPRPDASVVRDGATVTVTGEVRRFDWIELRRDYEWFDLDPGLRIELESRPVIVATSVRRDEDDGAE